MYIMSHIVPTQTKTVSIIIIIPVILLTTNLFTHSFQVKRTTAIVAILNQNSIFVLLLRIFQSLYLITQ